MTTRTITCLTVHCDVGGGPLLDPETDCEPHFATPEQAAEIARAWGWPVAGASGWICPETDAAHQAALDALLPPPPQPHCDGQTAMDTEGSDDR